MQLSDIQRTIKPEWDEFLSFYRQQLRSPVPEMDAVTEYVYEQKGKQLRPLLIFLCAKLNGAITQRTRVGATTVELFHVGTLLHDDVIDEAAERRGMPTVNVRWQSKIAVLVGDCLFIRGAALAIENEAYDFLQILAKSTQEIGEGELMQMQKSQDLDTDEALYIEIIRRKTASLLQACTHIGALSANATDEQVATMKSFGNLLGIAFQMRDDVLDYQSAMFTGKNEGNDIRERKLTLPLIFALQQVDKKQQKRILNLLADAKQKQRNVKAIMDFVKQQGGIRYAEEKTLWYAAQAKALLDIYPASETKECLTALLDYIVLRKK
jgi:octaprenyl-diphosphate synthase